MDEAWAMEGSESYDEEDEPEGRRRLNGLGSSLRMTISDFYTNLGDLTSPQRRQPGFGSSQGTQNGSDLATAANGSMLSLSGEVHSRPALLCVSNGTCM